MTVCCIVESASGHNAAAKALSGQDVRWLTTSPALLRRIPGMQSLEDGLPQEHFDTLGVASHNFATEFSSELEALCPWRGRHALGMAYMPLLRALFFVPLYKAMLMDRAAEGADRVVCVGDPAVTPVSDMHGGFGRFDTLYAWLAAGTGAPFEVLEHAVSESERNRLERSVVHRRLGVVEKFLSILTNTPGSFAYKAWKSLAARGVYPFKGICLWPRPRRRMFLLKDCELLEEGFLDLLLHGVRLERLSPIASPRVEADAVSPLPESEAFVAAFVARAKLACETAGAKWTPTMAVAANMAAERMATILSAARQALPELEGIFDRVSAPMRRGDTVLSNFFTSAPELLFHGHCRERGVTVAGFEHGVTLGLSEWGRWADAFCGIRYADIGVYHSRAAIESLGDAVAGQDRILAGMPQVTERMPLPGLKRRLARKWLGIGANEHVVTYVADLERNNFQYGPHIDTDLQYLRKTEAIVEHLATAHPRSTVLLKTYPTRRYVDLHEFEDLQEKYPNVRIVKDCEYRFMRAAADMTVFTSAQSTLGWVVHSGTEHLFIEFEWAPALLRGEERPCPPLPGAVRALAVDASTISDGDSGRFAKQLIKLTRKR